MKQKAVMFCLRDKEKFRRYTSADELKMKGKMYNHCWKSWMSAVVTWEGELLPLLLQQRWRVSLGQYLLFQILGEFGKVKKAYEFGKFF